MGESEPPLPIVGYGCALLIVDFKYFRSLLNLLSKVSVKELE
jgi:hypothetical protein